jgi:uncharacterized protein YhaN
VQITTISISGFGQFRGLRLEPAPGLTVVRGPNEAGKTTLLAFIRAILFGFETDRYPALAGGRRGGWLDVAMQDGRRFRIERYGERGGAGTLKVHDQAGADLGEGQLAALLQGVEKKVYHNIFAFGLDELTQFGRLSDAEVAARIYGAGAGTGSVSGLEVEKKLGSERESLFKPGGQNPTINALLRALEEVDAQLKERNLPAEYGEAGRRLVDVETTLARLGERHAALAAERRARQRVVDGWQAWLDLCQARADRELLGAVRTFPTTTVERLGRLESAVDAAAEVRRRAELDRDRAAADLDAATLDEEALARRAELEALGEAFPRHTVRRDERARTERELAAVAAAVKSAMARLGPGWTVERVAAFDDSISVQSEIETRFRRLLDRQADAVAAAQRDLAAVDQRRAEVAAQLAAASARIAQLDTELGGRAPHTDRERGLREVDRLLQRLEELQAVAADRPERDLHAARVTLDERSRRARELETAIESARSVRELLAVTTPTAMPLAARPPRWLGPLAVLVLGLVLAGSLLVAGSPALGVVVALAALVVAVAWALRSVRPIGAGPEEIGRRLQEQLDRTNETIASSGETLGLGSSPTPAEVAALLARLDEERRLLDRDVERLERADAALREATAAAAHLAAAASALGLPARPSREDLLAFGRQVDEDRKRDAQRVGLVEQAEQLRNTQERLDQQKEEAARDLEERLAAEQQARQEWRGWLVAHGLEPDLACETAAKVVEAVTAAKGALTTLRALEARRDEYAAEDAAFVVQVAALAPLLPEGRFDEADVAGAAAALLRRYDAALEGERRRGEAERALAERSAALEEARRSSEAAQAALAAFLAELEVADGDALRSEVERSTRGAALEEAIAAAARTLTTLSGPGEALAAFEADLSTVTDLDPVRGRIAELDEELAALAAQRDELNREAGALRDRRAAMERDAAATELRQRRADLQAQLEAAAERWAVLTLARDLLARSRAAYEQAHRPAVVQAAERHLGAWTGGRYPRIVAPLGASIEGVERRDGERIPLAVLSRGTAEQLYLALRFGLVERFVETSGEPLPIVMDDILVNFDDARAARAARSIEALARSCQVIYFTCHPSTPLHADLETALPLDG